MLSLAAEAGEHCYHFVLAVARGVEDSGLFQRVFICCLHSFLFYQDFDDFAGLVFVLDLCCVKNATLFKIVIEESGKVKTLLRFLLHYLFEVARLNELEEWLCHF